MVTARNKKQQLEEQLKRGSPDLYFLSISIHNNKRVCFFIYIPF
jgi:hypothetical protein